MDQLIADIMEIEREHPQATERMYALRDYLSHLSVDVQLSIIDQNNG